MKGLKCENRNSEERQRAEKLIDAIVYGNLSEELHGRLTEWFFSIPENGAAEETFGRWAVQNVKPKTSTPDAEEKKRFRKLVEILEKEEGGSRVGKKKSRHVIRRRFALRAVAVLIPVLIAAAVIVFHKEKVTDIALYANNGGSHEKFTLPDGANVTLEHGSKLVYSSDFVSDRRVTLDGEALFDVTRDPLHPFSVQHEGINIAALGTKFRVKAHDNIPEAEVILISGNVAVEIGDHRQELLPNQRLVLDKSTNSVVELSQVGPGTIMRATDSDLKIDDINAVDALSIVADYYEKELVIGEGMRSDNRLNILLPHDTSIETAIESLNVLSENARFLISGDTVYVSKK